MRRIARVFKYEINNKGLNKINSNLEACWLIEYKFK